MGGCAKKAIMPQGGFSGGPVITKTGELIGIYNGDKILPFSVTGTENNYVAHTFGTQLFSTYPFLGVFIDNFNTPENDILREDPEGTFIYQDLSIPEKTP